MKDERLSYDEIVELVVDSDDKIQPWSLRQEAKIAVALRELRQRREDERVSETLAGAAKHLPAPLSSNLVSRVSVVPVVVMDASEACKVEWKLGNRSFHIGADYWETREEGDYISRMFRAALDEYRAPAVAEFKNFHRLLCERFGYGHDDVDWKRDQLSLIEWIAKRLPGETKPSQGLMGRIENLAANNLTGCGTCSTIIDEIRRSEKTAPCLVPLGLLGDGAKCTKDKGHPGEHDWRPPGKADDIHYDVIVKDDTGTHPLKEWGANKVSRLHPSNAKLSRVSEAIESLLSAMRLNGMETLLCATGGYRIRAEPENGRESQS